MPALLTKWTGARWRAEKDHIGDLIKAKLVEVGQGHLKVRWKFNAGFTSKMGCARTDTDRRGGEMEFSGPLWPLASEEERDETVLHELAHVIVNCIHGYRMKWTRRGPRVQHHDNIFKSMLIRLGGTGARTHKVDNSQFKRRQARFGGACPGCGATISFSKSVRTKWLRGQQIRQHQCGQQLGWEWAARQGRVTE